MKKVYLIAIIVALITGCATYIFAQQIISMTTIKDADTVTVLVAKQDIKNGAMITAEQVEDLFEQKTVVSDYATPYPVSKFEDVVGYTLTRPIYAQEQLSENALQETGSAESGLSYQLNENEIAYSIIAEEQSGVDGYISEGDVIDIIAAIDVGDGDKEVPKAVVAFKDLEVLKVSTKEGVREAKSEGLDEVVTYSSITVRTNVKTATELYDMEIQSNSTFKIILKSKYDAEKILND